MIKDFFKRINNEITDIENSININKYFYDDINIWPMYRIGYFMFRKKEISNYNKISFFLKIKNKLSRALIYLINNISNDNLSDDIDCLYVGSNTHRTTIDGKFVNRYFNHLLNKNSRLIEYNNRLLKLERNTIDFNKIIINNKKIDSLNFKIVDNLTKDLSKILDDNEILDKVTIFVKNVLMYYSYSEIFLKRLNIKKIFFLSYYSAPALGLCIAANKLKIQTTEVQHGPIGKFHLAYCFNYKKLVKNLSTPNEIHIWHKSFKPILKNSFRKVNVTGNYYLNKYAKNINGHNPDKILITLQPKDSDLSNLIINIIKKFYCESKIVIRLHPRINISLDLKNKLNYVKKNYNVKISDPYMTPLHIDLKDTFVHITGYSGTSIEALSQNITTILLDKKANHFFENFINEEKMIFCDNLKENDVIKIIQKIKCSFLIKK